jgi:hypothetical protein
MCPMCPMCPTGKENKILATDTWNLSDVYDVSDNVSVVKRLNEKAFYIELGVSDTSDTFLQG